MNASLAHNRNLRSACHSIRSENLDFVALSEIIGNGRSCLMWNDGDGGNDSPPKDRTFPTEEVMWNDGDGGSD
jgi:hypothetical protein